MVNVNVNVKWFGLEVQGSLQFDSKDVYISGEVNLLDYTTISVGMTQHVDDYTEVDHQYSIEGNTYLVAAAIAYVVYGVPIMQTQGSGQPQYQPAY